MNHSGWSIWVLEFDIHLIDTLMPVVLLELIDLPIRIWESSRDIPPSVPHVCLNNEHVVEPEFFVARAQFLHIFGHRPILRFRSLRLRRIIRRILIYIAYVTRARADLHSIRVDYVVINNIRALRWKLIS